MILKIELAFPRFQTAVVLYALVQLIKEGTRGLLPHLRQAANALFHALGGLEHLTRRAAAAVAVAVGDQNIVVDLFILIALPRAHDGIGMQIAVVSRKEALLGILTDAERRDEMREHLGAVDALPEEGVIRDAVDLVPRELGGHEIVHAGLFHDLRQCAGIAEHIRQPQDFIILAEFLAEEALAVQELAHERLAGGQVAVGLEPHAALDLPAALRDALLDLFVHLRIALLEEIVQNRLAGHELIAGKLVHELEHRCKGAHDLFAGLRDRPPPRHVDVRMADTGGDDVARAAHFFIEIFRDILLRTLDGGIKVRRVRHAQIKQVDGIVQHGLKLKTNLAVLPEAVKSLQRHLNIIIQMIQPFVKYIKICKEGKLAVQCAGISLNVQRQLLAAYGALAQEHLAVVHIRALHDFMVDKDKELRILAVVPFLNLRVQLQPDGLAVHTLRDGDAAAEPIVRAGNAVKIRGLSLKFSLKLVGSGVIGVPVHPLAVKRLPRCGCGVGFLGTEELTLFVLPVGQAQAVGKAQHAELIADDLNPLVDKIHSFPSLA